MPSGDKGSTRARRADPATAAGAVAEPPGDDLTAPPPSTRERILDIALELFTKKGFDATSLQEVADQLGVTKAALYYHFRSKEDILIALHMRMHELGRRSLDQLAQGPVTLELWESVLSSVIRDMLAQRPLFLLHQRNQAAMERLHRDEGHEAQHEDLQAALVATLSNPAIALRDRVRMSCSIGAVFSLVFLSGDTLDADIGVVEPLVREALHDLLSGSAAGA